MVTLNDLEQAIKKARDAGVPSDAKITVYSPSKSYGDKVQSIEFELGEVIIYVL